jgi:hypothetical protein
MSHSIFEEARKRVFKDYLEQMSKTFQDTGKLVTPEIAPDAITDKLIELAKELTYYKPRGKKGVGDDKA